MSLTDGFERGIYRPRSPIGWILKPITGDSKSKFYHAKPVKYNQELFKIVPVYEVFQD